MPGSTSSASTTSTAQLSPATSYISVADASLGSAWTSPVSCSRSQSLGCRAHRVRPSRRAHGGRASPRIGPAIPALIGLASRGAGSSGSAGRRRAGPRRGIGPQDGVPGRAPSRRVGTTPCICPERPMLAAGHAGPGRPPPDGRAVALHQSTGRSRTNRARGGERRTRRPPERLLTVPAVEDHLDRAGAEVDAQHAASPAVGAVMG